MIHARATLTACLSALACACAAAPPARVETSFGELRAATPEEAAWLAVRAEELRAGLLELLPDSRPREASIRVFPDVEFLERHEDPELAGRVTPGFLGGPARIEVAASAFEVFVAHEWVHLVLGESWSSLPGVVEEGLANEAAFRLVDPSERAELRAGYLWAALGKDELDERLHFTGADGQPEELRIIESGWSGLDAGRPLEELLTLPRFRSRSGAAPAGSDRLYGVGTLLVERIAERCGGSFGCLHEACREHAGEGLVPPEVLLALAGFDSARAFERWLDEQLAEATARQYFSDPFELAGRAADVEHRVGRELSAEEFLDELQPAYQLGDRAVIPLAERADLQELVRRNWPRR